MKPLLIFDLDGTLADTSADLVGTLNVVLARHGAAPVAPADVQHLIGRGAVQLLAHGFGDAYAGFSDSRKQELLREFVAYYEDHLLDGTRLYPGVAGALRSLHDRGFPMAVCTSKNTRAADTILNGLGIRHHFRSVCGGDFFPGAKKPERAHVVGTLLQAGHANEHDAIFIGDSMVDVMSARNAGLPIVFVTYGYNDVDPVAADVDAVVAHADALAQSLCDLVANARAAA
jgi:phosphoglycolate phosphatase